MSEQNYDHDSVQELLAWAKETFNNKSYPIGEYQINTQKHLIVRNISIHDCCYFKELGETYVFPDH